MTYDPNPPVSPTIVEIVDILRGMSIAINYFVTHIPPGREPVIESLAETISHRVSALLLAVKRA